MICIHAWLRIRFIISGADGMLTFGAIGSECEVGTGEEEGRGL